MKLDQFLKWKGFVSTGGEAKYFIQAGKVLVNGSIESRRGRKLNVGDHVSFESHHVLFEPTDPMGS